MKRFACVLALLIAGCQAASPTRSNDTVATRPAVAVDSPASWAIVSGIIGKPGVFAREVYTITIPRDDLWVNNDTGDVPTAAGIETSIYFFQCPCGRLSVAGRFVVAEYEANDVMSELQTEGMIKIASLSPMLLHEKPKLLVIQFQGEGDPADLAKHIKAALDYTGDARMAPQKLPQ